MQMKILILQFMIIGINTVTPTYCSYDQYLSSGYSKSCLCEKSYINTAVKNNWCYGNDNQIHNKECYYSLLSGLN